MSAAERERTKRLVYASLYGAGTRKLMEILDVSYEQALQVAASFNSKGLFLEIYFIIFYRS